MKINPTTLIIFLILQVMIQNSFAQIRFEDSGQQLGNACSWGAELADLDGDGDLDAVVRNQHYQSTQVNQIWINDGTGHFAAGVQINEDADFVCGDLDGDNDIDIFIGGKILFNDGQMNFSESDSILDERAIGAPTLGDLDKDGDLDLFVVRFNQDATVWLNDGNANFTDTGQSLTATGMIGATLGDLDNDGDLDAFIYSRPDNGSVPGNPNVVFLNDGYGNFTDNGQRLGNEATGDAALGDVNNDGFPDVVVANYHTPDNVVPEVEQRDNLYLNNGDGTFTDSGQQFDAAISRGVELGDLDGDGDLDLYVFHSQGSMYARPDKVWLNDGQGHFSDSGLQIGNATSANGALGDLDGDGDLDVFVPATRWRQTNPGEANKIYFNNLYQPTSIKKKKNNSPNNFKLNQNFPNPFNPSTTIQYSLNKPSSVKLSIYNINGQEIKILENAFHSKGNFETAWNSTDMNGDLVSSGMYFYQLEANDFSLRKKMVLIQ